MTLGAPYPVPVCRALTSEAPRGVDARGPVLTAQVSARVLTTLIDVYVTERALPRRGTLAEEPVVPVHTRASVPTRVRVAFVLCQQLL